MLNEKNGNYLLTIIIAFYDCYTLTENYCILNDFKEKDMLWCAIKRKWNKQKHYILSFFFFFSFFNRSMELSRISYSLSNQFRHVHKCLFLLEEKSKKTFYSRSTWIFFRKLLNMKYDIRLKESKNRMNCINLVTMKIIGCGN